MSHQKKKLLIFVRLIISFQVSNQSFKRSAIKTSLRAARNYFAKKHSMAVNEVVHGITIMLSNQLIDSIKRH